MTTDMRAIFTADRDSVAARLLSYLAAGPTLLVGPPGTGKTSEAFACAASQGKHAYIAHSDPGALSDRYVGGYKPLGGVWSWVDGVILRAMREGALLIVDDLHLMGPDGQAALYQACDFGPGSTFSLDDGSQVTPAPGYCVVGTMNGDPSRLDEAVRSRFRNVIPVLEPSSAMLAALVNGRCAPCATVHAGMAKCPTCAGALDIDDEIAMQCDRDYQAGAERVGEYREWQALATNLRSGLPLALAIGGAFADGDGTLPSHYDRCQSVLKALHTAAYPGAGAVLTQMAGQLPSGAPVVTIGS